MDVSDDEQASVRRPTIRDVAAVAGVSKSVVSRVYSGSMQVSPESRKRVEAAAVSLGFRPNWVARSLAGQRDDFVGILVADLHNPVFAAIVDAARAELARFGQVGLLTSALMPRMNPDSGHLKASNEAMPQLDAHALALFGDLRPARLLLVGTVPDPGRVVAASPHARIVAASSIPGGVPTVRVVRGDDDAGMRLVLEHLIAQGHRDIAHVGGAGGPVSQVRAAAYSRLMSENGLAAHTRVMTSDYSQQAGLAAARVLLESPVPPTAIVAVNDLAGIGALIAVDEYARQTGRAVAVTGYDNTFMAAIPQIGLTSVDPGNDYIGREAARLLMNAESPPAETLVAPTLFPRRSSLRA